MIKKNRKNRPLKVNGNLNHGNIILKKEVSRRALRCSILALLLMMPYEAGDSKFS